MQFVPPFLSPTKFLLFLRGQLHVPGRGRYISAHKIEIDFNRLRGVLASFAVTLMDKDFIDKFIEHGVCHGLKTLVFVNQSDKLFRRFLPLVVAADDCFFRDAVLSGAERSNGDFAVLGTSVLRGALAVVGAMVEEPQP